VRFHYILFLLFVSCLNTSTDKPKPLNLELNWEDIYAKELDRALKNEDHTAFRFFWPYYLQERYKNKLKQAGLNYELYK